jgi:hypothetical protein
MTEIPLTSVSLGYHSLSEPNRTALHVDTAGTLDRFGITEDTYQAYLKNNRDRGSKKVKAELASADDMLATAIALERAAAEVRKHHSSVADTALAGLIEKFLGMAASWVAAEVALGVTAPDQPIATEPGDLIRRMYLLLYSSDFRKSPDAAGFDPDAWKVVLGAVKAGGGHFDELLPHCRKLCGAVANEFTSSLWPWVW